MSSLLRKLGLVPLSIARVEKTVYPGDQHYEVQKEIRDRHLTGTFIIDYHQGRERAVRWEATEHNRN